MDANTVANVVMASASVVSAVVTIIGFGWSVYLARGAAKDFSKAMTAFGSTADRFEKIGKEHAEATGTIARIAVASRNG